MNIIGAPDALHRTENTSYQTIATCLQLEGFYEKLHIICIVVKAAARKQALSREFFVRDPSYEPY